jgi:hypothetical protein
LRNLTVTPRDEQKPAPRKVGVVVKRAALSKKKKPTPIIIETGKKKNKRKLVVKIRPENEEKVNPNRYIEDYMTKMATKNTVWNRLVNGKLLHFIKATHGYIHRVDTNANMIKIEAYITDD